MEGLTRISDLPDNITMSGINIPASETRGSNPASSMSTSYNPNIDVGPGAGDRSQPPPTSGYTPLNAHPNPYGQGPSSQMPPPQHTKMGSNGSRGGDNPYLDMGNNFTNDPNLAGPHAHLGGMPQYPLPQRDIPMDTTGYMHDETIQPNYVPGLGSNSAAHGGGFVESQEERMKRQRKLRRGKLFSGNWSFDDVVAELQQPIIVAIIFFIFQSPSIHLGMAKYLSFMTLFGDDGNINTLGIFMKSVLFGLAYFAWARFIEYLDIE